MKKLLVNIVAVVALFTFVIAFGTVSFLAFDIPLQKENDGSILSYGYSKKMLELWHGELIFHKRLYQPFFDYDKRRVIIRGGILVAQ